LPARQWVKALRESAGEQATQTPSAASDTFTI